MSSSAPSTKKSRTDWRQKCVDEFGLLDLPDNWSSARLSKLSASSDEIWERYYKYQIEHNPQNSGEDDGDSEDNDDYYDDDGSQVLLREIKDALASEVDNVGGDLARSWLKHTAQSVTRCCWEDFDELRSANYRAVMFSPFAIPRAVELSHRYHHRTRHYSVEFYCTWEFKLVRFDGEPGGDHVQNKLAQRFPEGWNYGDDSPCIFDAASGEETLCSNSFIDPPSDEADWCAVERIDVSNFTPTTCRRIREWVLGPRHKSLASLDDYSFLRLLFASCGSAGFDTNKGDIGYCWSSYRSDFSKEVEEAKRDGVMECDDEEDDESEDSAWSLNWLEHQARLISGALRPPDMYYEPYDISEAKGEWGRQVLDRREEREERSYNKVDDDGDDVEEEDLRKVPWLVWDRAEKNQGTAGALELMMKVMGVRGGMH